MSYKRVLLKLSGEQLAGQYESGIDPIFGAWLAREIKKAHSDGTEIVIMVGGGNFMRGAQIAGHGIARVTADHMGMLATMINALALTDIFEANGLQTRCLSNIFAEQVAEKFIHRLANKHIDNGRVIIVAGGSGRPYLTTDTAAVEIALELDCVVVLKATKVDGVYDKDPTKHNNAEKIDKISHQEALEQASIPVMDQAALGLALEHKMPILIFDSMSEGNIVSAIKGQKVGTLIG